MSTVSSTEEATGSGLAKFGTVLHTAMISALLAFSIWRIPTVKQVCDEFGITLPLATQYLFQLSAWLGEHWQTITSALLLLPIVDFIAIQFCRRWGRSAQLSWIVGIGVLLFVVGIYTALSCELPLIQLKEGLSH